MHAQLEVICSTFQMLCNEKLTILKCTIEGQIFTEKNEENNFPLL